MNKKQIIINEDNNDTSKNFTFHNHRVIVINERTATVTSHRVSIYLKSKKAHEKQNCTIMCFVHLDFF